MSIESTMSSLMNAPELPVVPPPWELRGDGYVLLYHFSRAFGERESQHQPPLAGRWRGMLSAVTWMFYNTSGVGPYGELMVIPGVFAWRGRRDFSITRIYVSTWESVVSGRANWGIPKDRADISVERRSSGEEHLVAALDGNILCEMLCRPSRFSLPVSTRFLPITLMQVWEGQTFYTPFTLQADVHWLDVIRISSDGDHFPSLAGETPLIAVKLANFAVTYPIPRIVANDGEKAQALG